jgi:hypothetical protein
VNRQHAGRSSEHRQRWHRAVRLQHGAIRLDGRKQLALSSAMTAHCFTCFVVQAGRLAALAQFAQSARHVESAAMSLRTQLQRRYRLYNRLEAALALPAGPKRLEALLDAFLCRHAASDLAG